MASNLAYLFVSLAGITILFQLALISGAPLGHLTQGRTQKGPLPTAARAFALLSIIMLLLMSGAILSAAGLWPFWADWTGWLTVAILGLGVLLNGITPSQAEKRLWLPVSTLMFFAAIGVLVL